MRLQVRKYLKKLSKELNNLYQKYGPIEVNYKIPFEEKEKYMIDGIRNVWKHTINLT